jgi:hypothetical protein
MGIKSWIFFEVWHLLCVSQNTKYRRNPYHSNIENLTAPLETDAKSHLGPPLPQHHIHVYHSSPTVTASYRSNTWDISWFNNYHTTNLGVHSLLPTADYGPGRYYSPGFFSLNVTYWF